MRVLAWIVRIVLFFLLFAFALKNTEAVSLRFFFDAVWQAPLVMVLLISFAAGALFGLLAASGTLFGQRRELLRLRRQVAVAEQAADTTGRMQEATPPEAGHA